MAAIRCWPGLLVGTPLRCGHCGTASWHVRYWGVACSTHGALPVQRRTLPMMAGSMHRLRRQLCRPGRRTRTIKGDRAIGGGSQAAGSSKN